MEVKETYTKSPFCVIKHGFTLWVFLGVGRKVWWICDVGVREVSDV